MIPACNEKSFASAIIVSTTIFFLILFMMKILLIINKGNRGVSMISNLYGKANNPYMGEDHDPSKPTKSFHHLS